MQKQPIKDCLKGKKKLKSRESAIASREANQNERDEEIVLLKRRVNELSTSLNDMEAQNKELQLKVLCNKNTRETYTRQQNATDETVDKLASASSALQTMLLIAATNMLSSHKQQPAPSTKITNVYNQGDTRHDSHIGKGRKTYDYSHRSRYPTTIKYDSDNQDGSRYSSHIGKGHRIYDYNHGRYPTTIKYGSHNGDTLKTGVHKAVTADFSMITTDSTDAVIIGVTTTNKADAPTNDTDEATINMAANDDAEAATIGSTISSTTISFVVCGHPNDCCICVADCG